jgi:hypothetical protein
VSGLVQDNCIADDTARRATDYWYQVQAVDLAGRLSEPSAPIKYRY